MIGLAAGLLAAGAARAGTETFDTTGLTNNWVSAGAFTGQESRVWTFANARGYPTVYATNPSLTLRTGNLTTNKGWLLSPTLTGGVQRVAAAFKQETTNATDCLVLVNGLQVGRYVSAGVSGAVEVVAFDAYDSSNRLPFTNDFTVMLSNRIASAGAVAVDDLAWEPFQLFVRLDRTGTNLARAGLEFDAQAQVFDLGQEVTGNWSIAPAFAGTPSDTNAAHLTLIPAEADVGQTFTVTYTATDTEGTGHVAQAGFNLMVEEAVSPRIIDFETAGFGYDTNSGVVTNLNGMNWKFFNVRTSDATDRKLGAVSARFRHSADALPATMESQDMFDGIGTLSLHYAYYGATNRTVTFAVQVRADGEEDWTTVPDGTFNVNGHDDITNSEFAVDIQEPGQRYVRLVTTGNYGEIADLDDIEIRAFGDVLPRLVWSGGTNVPVGRETVLDFVLTNAAGIVRTWDYELAPANAQATFEITGDDQLRLRFAPVDTNEWGDYAVTVTASIGGETAGATSLVLRVVSPPAFTLAPVATNLTVPELVDVWVTNVVLHGAGTNWTTEWQAAPPFANPCTVSNKSRFRIGTGTVEADAGSHALTAVLTDAGTGVQTTGAVVLAVTGTGGGDLTNETYFIVAYDITNHVVVSGRVGRVYVPYGTTNLTLGAESSNWTWQGAAVTNTDGTDVLLEVPVVPDPRLFFYGVRVRAAP